MSVAATSATNRITAARLVPLEESGAQSQQAQSQPRSSLNTAQPRAPLLQGVYIKLGSQRFYVTHIRDEREMGHSEQEWNTICASKISEFAGELDLDLDTVEQIELCFDQPAQSTYTLKDKPNASSPEMPKLLNITSKAKPHFNLLRRTLEQSHGRPSIRIFGFKTTEGSYDQARTRLVQEGPEAERVKHTNACTAIDLQFAQEALLLPNGTKIGNQFINNALLKGQLKYAKVIRPAIIEGEKARMAQAGSQIAEDPDGNLLGEDNAPIALLADFPSAHDAGCFPLLQRGAMLRLEIPQLQAKDAFLEKLEELASSREVDTLPVFGGFTTEDGESYGVVIYASGEVVYFDSHSNPINGAKNNNACAKHFRSLEEAAEFLAQRNRFVAGSSNEITITPFYMNVNFVKFLQALNEYRVADGNDSPDAQQKLTALTAALQALIRSNRAIGAQILYLLSIRTPPVAGRATGVEDALQKIQSDPGVLLHIDETMILNYLRECEQRQFPMPERRAKRAAPSSSMD